MELHVGIILSFIHSLSLFASPCTWRAAYHSCHQARSPLNDQVETKRHFNNICFKYIRMFHLYREVTKNLQCLERYLISHFGKCSTMNNEGGELTI